MLSSVCWEVFLSFQSLNTKDGAEFLRISAAYQRILNKNVIYDAPRRPSARYNPDMRVYPGGLCEYIL
jgi:hypothetical protein